MTSAELSAELSIFNLSTTGTRIQKQLRLEEYLTKQGRDKKTGDEKVDHSQIDSLIKFWFVENWRTPRTSEMAEK